MLLNLTSTNKRVRDEDLLSLTARGRSTAGGGRRDAREGRLRSGHALGLLAVGTDARVRARVALLVLEKDGSNVVDSDVDGVSDTRNREDALRRARKHDFAGVETSAGSVLDLFDLGSSPADAALSAV